MSIFGQDIEENVRFLTTFSDGERPLVLDAIIQAKLPCQLDSNGLPCYNQFNNGSIFASSQMWSNKRFEIDWEDRQKNLKTFFEALSDMPSKSLLSTRNTLSVKELLYNYMSSLKSTNKDFLLNIVALRKNKESIIQHKKEIEANKNFRIESTELVPHKESLKKGSAMNCSDCQLTCHYPCIYFFPTCWCPIYWHGFSNIESFWKSEDTESFIKQFIPKPSDICKICTTQCSRKHHTNEKFRWVRKLETKTITYTEMLQRYEEANKKKMSAEELVKRLQFEIEELKDKSVNVIKEITDCSKKLSQMTLCNDPITTSEYIESMINHEIMKNSDTSDEHTKERVKTLEDLLEKVKADKETIY